MKNLLLIFVLFLNPFVLTAAIDECKTDVYFANGILTKEEIAYDNSFLLRKNIIKMLGQEAFTQKIGKVTYAYNETHGFLPDGIETFLQKSGIAGLSDLFGASHGRDLSEQITAYKQSIKAGHKVLAVAHSQGNLFTYEALRGLDPWMQDYFEAVSVASPMSADIKYGTTRIDWDNDIVPRIATLGGALPDMIHSNARNVSWESNNVFGSGQPASDYVTNSDIGKTYNKGGYPYVANENGLNSAVHAFTFYMGDILKDKDGKTILNPFTDTTLIDTSAKTKIMNAIATKLDGFCKCGNATNDIQPTSGIINISLGWSDADIAMNLSSAIGTKDITASECSPFEHYYVASEEEVSPGTYGVYVTNSGGVEESYLPQSVSLNIHVPGVAVMVFDFNITAADMLNLGHVADIIITEDKKSAVVPVARSTGSTGTVSCYGDCKGSESTRETYQEYLYEIQSKLKQALLGPLSNADIRLTNAINFQSSIPLYESSTSAGNSLLTSGIFYFTSEVLNTLESDTYYVMSVIGGEDIDANDDGVLDATPTQNLGSIHAVIETNTLKNENFKVNILSEVAFQLTKELMNEELNATQLQEKLDDIAVRLLIEDVDGNKEINYKDLLAWVPIGDKEKLRKPYEEFYEPIVQKIYKNEAIYDDAYALAYEPFVATPIVINDASFKMYNDSTALSKVGALAIIKNGNTIENITLSGDGSGDFSIDTDGVIRVATGVTLQSSRKDYYTLTVRVNDTYEATVTITVRKRIVGSIDTRDAMRGITLSADGTKAYVTGGSSYSGLRIINISDQAMPYILASISTPNFAKNVVLSADGTKAYVADGSSGLQIIDVSNSASPYILASANTSGFAQNVTLSADGTKAYVADGSSGLQIIDISNPGSPTILASVDTPNSAESVILSADGTKAYVADAFSGLQIIDISNPHTSTILASVEELGYAADVTLSADGTKAYVADLFSGLHIIDISNPDTPTMLASVDTPATAVRVTLSADGTKAYIADNCLGLQIIDISDPSTPAILLFVDTPGCAQNVTLSPDGTKAYVTDSTNLQIINISGMEVPQKAPGIRGFTSIIEANLIEGSVVGEVKVYYSGESGITSFRLEGDRAEDFSIDAQGRVTLVNALDPIPNNLYTLKAVAVNSTGEKEADISIHIR